MWQKQPNYVFYLFYCLFFKHFVQGLALFWCICVVMHKYGACYAQIEP